MEVVWVMIILGQFLQCAVVTFGFGHWCFDHPVVNF